MFDFILETINDIVCFFRSICGCLFWDPHEDTVIISYYDVRPEVLWSIDPPKISSDYFK